MSKKAPNFSEVPPKIEDVTGQDPDADVNGRDTIDSTKDEDDARKMFIGGLSWETTLTQLQEYFEKFGSIKEVTIKTDFMGRSRGFGFVLFHEDDSVKKVLDEKTHSLNNKKIDPKRAEARGGKEPIRKVFVGGVAVELPEDDIRKHFEKFGPVTDIEFPFNKLKNERKGFCFVTFADAESCEKAAEESKQCLGEKQVDVKKAIPKEDPKSWGEPGYWRGGAWRVRGRGRGGYSGFPPYYYGDYYGPYIANGQGYPGYNNNYYYDYYGPQYPSYTFQVAQNYTYNQQQQQQAPPQQQQQQSAVAK